MRRIYNSKRSQAELITTVLIILISIAAVALVASFIFNMVKNNLKGTECFQAAGQLSIDSDYTYFNSSSKMLYVSIKRGDKAFNLTGIKLVYGNEKSSKTITLNKGVPSLGVYNLKRDGTADISATGIAVPDVGLSKAYVIDMTSFGNVNKLSVFPLLAGNSNCELSDESVIETK